jgi:hypothetical protein
MTTLLHHAFATYDSESFESVLQDLLAVLRHHFGWVRFALHAQCFFEGLYGLLASSECL